MTLHPAVQRENVKALEVDDVIKENTIEFDFLGKDSVQYLKQVVVHRRVYHLMQKWVPRDADGRGAPAVCPHHPPSPPLPPSPPSPKPFDSPLLFGNLAQAVPQLSAYSSPKTGTNDHVLPPPTPLPVRQQRRAPQAGRICRGSPVDLFYAPAPATLRPSVSVSADGCLR